MVARATSFSRIPGVRVGHAVAAGTASGVTVVRFDRARPVVVDVRGGASATYDIGSLSLAATYGRRWAIFFAGGSVFGLDAARGVRTRLLEEGDGHRAFANPNAILPITGAALFDLPTRTSPIPDYLPLGYAASRAASHAPFPDGATGAGAGASVGKYRGRSRASPGGLGAVAARSPWGRVGALVVVNAVGAVRDPTTGAWVAGARDRRGAIDPPDGRGDRRRPGDSHTTLALVVTELVLGRPALARVAEIAAGGLARAVVPYATSLDGDLLFVASREARRLSPRAGPIETIVDRIGAMAADLVVEATLRAVRRPARGR